MSLPGAVSSLIEESRHFELTGEIGSAFQSAQQALQTARQLGEPDAIAAALVCLAAVHFRLGHDINAINLAKEALQVAGPDDIARVDAYLMLGMCGEAEDYISDREKYYKQAIDLGRQLGYHRAMLRGLHNLASGVYLPCGQFDLALAADEEALRLANGYGMPELSWAPLTTMSWIYWITGQIGKAQAVLNELTQVSLPESLGKGYFFCTSANLAIEKDLLDQAPPLYARARSIAETIGAPDLAVNVRLGLSHYYLKTGDWPTAFTWVNDALDIAHQAGYRYLEGISLVDRGRIALEAYSSDSEIAHTQFLQTVEPISSPEDDFRTAISLLTTLHSHFELARAYLLLAVLYHLQKHPKAEETWLAAVQQISAGGYDFLVIQERFKAYSLVSDYLNSHSSAISESCGFILKLLKKVPAEPLRVISLGGLQIWQGARYIEKQALRQRRAGELLMLLLANPKHTLLFDQVSEALCPGEDIDTAKGVLHHATSNLRRVLEPELPAKLPSRYLTVEDNQVSLALPDGSWLDFESFEQLCQNGEWETALTLCGGEFLPEYLYADWTVNLRQRLSHWLQRALLVVAEKRFGSGQYASALATCQRLLEIEPWHEQGVLIAMRACIALNNQTRAIKLYRDLEKTLRTELGTTPDEELQTLARDLLHKK